MFVQTLILLWNQLAGINDGVSPHRKFIENIRRNGFHGSPWPDMATSPKLLMFFVPRFHVYRQQYTWEFTARGSHTNVASLKAKTMKKGFDIKFGASVRPFSLHSQLKCLLGLKLCSLWLCWSSVVFGLLLTEKDICKGEKYIHRSQGKLNGRFFISK